MDSAYIDYEKLETLTQREVMYVTKMKKDLKYNIIEDCMHQTYEGLIEVHIQNEHSLKRWRMVQFWLIMPVSLPMLILKTLLTNDIESDPKEIIEIYRKRWEIEMLVK